MGWPSWPWWDGSRGVLPALISMCLWSSPVLCRVVGCLAGRDLHWLRVSTKRPNVCASLCIVIVLHCFVTCWQCHVYLVTRLQSGGPGRGTPPVENRGVTQQPNQNRAAQDTGSSLPDPLPCRPSRAKCRVSVARHRQLTNSTAGACPAASPRTPPGGCLECARPPAARQPRCERPPPLLPPPRPLSQLLASPRPSGPPAEPRVPRPTLPPQHLLLIQSSSSRIQPPMLCFRRQRQERKRWFRFQGPERCGFRSLRFQWPTQPGRR